MHTGISLFKSQEERAFMQEKHTNLYSFVWKTVVILPFDWFLDWYFLESVYRENVSWLYAALHVNIFGLLPIGRKV